jgi:hypothetical protein
MIALALGVPVAARAGAPEGSTPTELCTAYGDEAQACFTPPAAGWKWKPNGEGVYAVVPPAPGVGFRVAFTGIKTFTPDAIAAQLGRVIDGAPNPMHSFDVTASSVAGPGSFHFVSDGPASLAPGMKTVGYVTPSGWMVVGIFDAGRESPEFVQFVRSYSETRRQ